MPGRLPPGDRQHLHDYRRRAYGLAEIAQAKLEIELPQLENEDKSIDDAAIHVRIGFDGKPPTEIGDNAIPLHCSSCFVRRAPMSPTRPVRSWHEYERMQIQVRSAAQAR